MNDEGSLPPYVVIAGYGGMAREARAWIADTYPDQRVLGFVGAPDTPDGTHCLDLPVWSAFQALPHPAHKVACVVAIGTPSIRGRVADEAEELGHPLLTVVHPTAYVGPGVTLRPGVLVCPQATITRDISVGRAAIVNYAAAVGHDCSIGDHAFIGPGATLGGGVYIGSFAYVGLGARILPDLSVGQNATVGAGAVVTRDVEAGATVTGTPARSTSTGSSTR